MAIGHIHIYYSNFMEIQNIIPRYVFGHMENINRFVAKLNEYAIFSVMKLQI